MLSLLSERSHQVRGTNGRTLRRIEHARFTKVACERHEVPRLVGEEWDSLFRLHPRLPLEQTKDLVPPGNPLSC